MKSRLKKNGKRSVEPTAPIEALVCAGQEKFALDFSGEQQSFDAIAWNVSGFKDRLATQSYEMLYFTRYGAKDQPLPQLYVEVVKSWIILERHSIGNMFQRRDAARMLWEAILLRRGNEPLAFHWQGLCEEDLSQAELFMRKHWAQTTTYKVGIQLLVMTTFLGARNVCRPLYYTLQTPRPEDLNNHTIAGQEARKSKLPSMKALEGVADIYCTYAKDPSDQLRAAALAILVVTGFRIGELLTLPLECEVTDIHDGKSRYGLRYYKEKSRGAEKMFDVRWLTTTGTELARKAIAEIREITTSARERARILEQNPNRVPIPGYQWADRMSLREIMNVTGLKSLSRYLVTNYRVIRMEIVFSIAPVK